MSLKKNTTALNELLEMANGLSEPAIEPLAVTKNGTYTAPEGVDGYSPITVDVPVPDGYIVPSGELEVTENGIHDVTEYATVNVNVAASGDTSAEDRLLKGTLTEYRNDRITSIRDYAFYYNTKLISADFSKLKSVGRSAFRYCENLTTVNGPSITIIYNGGFRDCTNLVNINMPAVGSIDQYAFCECEKLAKVDLPVAYGFYQYSFGYCTSLETLILRRPTMCKLYDVKGLYETPIANGTGYIYVPKTLSDGSDGVEAYKASTNWSAYADQIRAIEDYPEITGG